MPKIIPIRVKKNVISKLAAGENIKDICKYANISIMTLYKIKNQNFDLFKKILEEKRLMLGASAQLTAQKVVNRIKKDKINDSTALQLAQTSKILCDISDNKDNSLIININNMPSNKEDMIKDILNADVIGNTIQDNVIDNDNKIDNSIDNK